MRTRTVWLDRTLVLSLLLGGALGLLIVSSRLGLWAGMCEIEGTTSLRKHLR